MADKILDTRIKLKVDTAENWNNNNPILLNGEMGLVRKNNTCYAVVGDGQTAFNNLDKFGENLVQLLFPNTFYPKNSIIINGNQIGFVNMDWTSGTYSNLQSDFDAALAEGKIIPMGGEIAYTDASDVSNLRSGLYTVSKSTLNLPAEIATLDTSSEGGTGTLIVIRNQHDYQNVTGLSMGFLYTYILSYSFTSGVGATTTLNYFGLHYDSNYKPIRWVRLGTHEDIVNLRSTVNALQDIVSEIIDGNTGSGLTYKTGNWTPTFQSAISPSNFGYLNATYTLLGNQCTIECAGIYEASTSGFSSTYLYIGGLPYAPKNQEITTTIENDAWDYLSEIRPIPLEWRVGGNLVSTGARMEAFNASVGMKIYTEDGKQIRGTSAADNTFVPITNYIKRTTPFYFKATYEIA